MPAAPERLRAISARLRLEFLREGSFVGHGGWTEMSLTVVLLWQAMVVYNLPQALWDTEALRPFVYAQVHSVYVALVPGAVGAICTAGMLLGWARRGGWTSWWIRCVGMVLQAPCWAWLAISSYHSAGLALLSIPMYVVCGFLGTLRVVALIWAHQSTSRRGAP